MSAPPWMPQPKLVELISSRLGWIRSRQAELTKPKEDGVRLWGELFPLATEVVPGAGRVWLDEGVIRVSAPEKNLVDQVLRTWRRDQLRAALPPLLDRWQDRLGVQVRAITVREMTTRWGTCNHQTARVSFSTLLTEKDPELLEYVVVHELAHLIVANHGPEFKAVLNQHLPNWVLLRKRLNSPT